tara:strand:- start:552 stop:896 length:345 start_codon:yes stop_codon:yes gene_type:complete
MRQASKRENIIMVYTKDMSVSYSDIALLTDSNVNYVNQCIHNYHIDLVSYYDMCLAPSLVDSDIYFLFSDNGAEKRLKFKNNIVTPENELTQLEELYVKLNLSNRIAHYESGVF